MLDYQNLRTIRQLAEETTPIFTEGKLRWWVYNADKNGLKMAIVRVGGRIYLDKEAFNQWLESLRSTNTAAVVIGILTLAV
ncbi:MAG: DNA-binding protein [Blastochloris viridis]|uniref:DNA-binding protein n=1 Tax=Blastochloris viridis TaxID=1079 RepID=A0A6N4RAU7_BLAVI|nr:MAG: DNA-binding protein [Blastochloris viridis]